MSEFELMARGELLGTKIVLNRMHARIWQREYADLDELRRTEHAAAVDELLTMPLLDADAEQSEKLREYALHAIDRILVDDKAATTPWWWHTR
ncbi:hypothetical protein ACLBXM_20040 [Xanthobacteraceae bacterium A53D]